MTLAPPNPRRGELELLAPARDAAIAIAALEHGADAVYIGGPGFGARAKAGNSVADLEQVARHAHRYHARVFCTLNTILRDDELEPARRLAWQLHEAGVDALIIQDMGLLQLDLPPLQLHASTQTDIRTPAKARFLQDVGFSQMVLARELTLAEIRAIAAEVPRAMLEFFVHGALCVAYSGVCHISHALTGRSANRGSCSQECRQPYTLTDPQGRIVAKDAHLLSLKDNDQSANLAALIEAGIRSFKIEGRYKDIGYVKNVTAFYRRRLDELLDANVGGQGLRPASHGRCRHGFTPDPSRSFNREATDYFVRGRQLDIGAFGSPKHAGLGVAEVTRLHADALDVTLDEGVDAIANGDGLTWWDAQGELQGVQVNTARVIDDAARLWRLTPNEELRALKDLRRGTRLHRNHDLAWERRMARADSAERRIPLQAWLHQREEAGNVRLTLTLADDHGHSVEVAQTLPQASAARDLQRSHEGLRTALTKMGGTPFSLAPEAVQVADTVRAFVPAAAVNALRRAAVAALETARWQALPRLPRAPAVTPPVPYPEASLSYLGNVHNHKARDFYARHGVGLIEAAYESHERLDDVSLMVTRHCIRWSLSLCPKQAKGVTGVQGTVKAEPMTLTQGDRQFTLRFDCKPCEMHVVGRMQPQVLREARALAREHEASRAADAMPITFYRHRPAAVRG